MAIEYYLYYWYYTLIGYPFVIRVAIWGIFLFTVLFIIIVRAFLKNRSSFKRRKKLQEKIDELYRGQLQIIIEADENFSKEDVSRMLSDRIKKLSKLHKRILTNQLVQLRNEAFQVNRDNYIKAVDFFEIQDFWERRLKNGSINEQMKALRKFDDLDISLTGSTISPLTYNRNSYIRRKARTYYTYFNKNSPYKFFDEDFDKTFNKWDEIELHRILVRRQKEGLPGFSQWAKKSRNTSFICFLIDEIAFFKQTESAPYLVELIKNEDIEIRKHAVRALGNLNYQQSEDILTQEYVIQPISIQEEIIQAIKKMNTGRSLDFLKRAYYTSNSHEMKIIILGAIFNYGEPGKSLFHMLQQSASGFARLIFDHVSNPLLN